ncbi:hypothetical protein [Escherichia coli]
MRQNDDSGIRVGNDDGLQVRIFMERNHPITVTHRSPEGGYGWLFA